VFGLYPVSKRLGVVINGLCFEIALDPVDRDRLITKMFFERQYREDSRLSIDSRREKEPLPLLFRIFPNVHEIQKVGCANERTDNSDLRVLQADESTTPRIFSAFSVWNYRLCRMAK